MSTPFIQRKTSKVAERSFKGDKVSSICDDIKLCYKALKKEKVYYLPHYLYRFMKSRIIQVLLNFRCLRNIDKKISKNVGTKYIEASQSKYVFLDEDQSCLMKKIKEDKELYDNIIHYANAIMENRFFILNGYRDNLFSSETNHFNWSQAYKICFSDVVNFPDMINPEFQYKDIKHVWEFARMQYLVTLGVAFYITKDEKYAQKVKDILYDFLECNPCYVGENWKVSMEVGIRVANMVLAFELIKKSTVVDDEFILKFSGSIYEHYRFIKTNRENIGGKTYNHFIGGLLGEVVCCAYLAPINRFGKKLYKCRRFFEKELKVQILADGVDFEGSTYYHRLAGEMFAYIF